MDEKDWRILKTIAEEKSITRAATRLFISQPALTYRLKNLEEEFGAQLVLRMPNGVVLTSQGEYLLSYANQMLLSLESAKDHIKNMENKVQGALRMGSSAVYAHFVLPKMLKGFLEQYPEVELSLKTGLSHQVLRMLEKQEIALGVVRGDHPWEGEKFLLTEEAVCLVSRSNLQIDELLNQPHIRYGTDTRLQKMIDDWWRQYFKAPPHTTMEVNTMDTARQLVLHGLGWTVLPTIGLPKDDDTLFVKPLYWRDGSPLRRQTWLFCTEGARQLQTVRAFIDYLKEKGQILG